MPVALKVPLTVVVNSLALEGGDPGTLGFGQLKRNLLPLVGHFLLTARLRVGQGSSQRRPSGRQAQCTPLPAMVTPSFSSALFGVICCLS
jgi:hypothetical protein